MKKKVPNKDPLEDIPDHIEEQKRRDNIEWHFKMLVPQWREELKELSLYLNTLEEYIDEEEKQELERLDERETRLKASGKSLDWAWAYPIHWEEVFRSRLRASFIIMLISFSESCLELTSILVDSMARPPIKRSSIRGNLIERSKLFINAFGRFMEPTEKQWITLSNIYDVRCVMVHKNSRLTKSDRKGRIESFIREVPGLEISNDCLKLERDFCEYCLEFMTGFCSSLSEGLEKSMESFSVV